MSAALLAVVIFAGLTGVFVVVGFAVREMGRPDERSHP